MRFMLGELGVRSVLWLLPVVVLLAAVSCDHEPEFLARPDPEPAPAVKPDSFDASTCGRVTGRATWFGPRPNPQAFLFGKPNANGGFTPVMMPNPNAPAIADAGIANAVVFLRGIDASRAKQWDLPAVRVELKDRNIHVVQGELTGRVGFVRVGDSVEMKSAEPVFHVLRARGNAFFSLTFPQPEQPLTRNFMTPGRVELSSGAGLYWACADLLITDHPYWTRTDSAGRFTFEHVPPGSFEVVGWLPGWEVVKQDRDPETGLVTRQAWSAPIEAASHVKLEPKSAVEAALTFRK